MTFKNYKDAWKDQSDTVSTVVEDNPVVEPKIGYVFNCEKVYLRKAASQDSDYVEILDRGTELFIESVDGHWCKVTTSDDEPGYVMKKFVKIEA